MSDDLEEPGIGHNSNVENVAAAELRNFLERIERLEEEKAAIASDVKDVFGEAKGRGYDTQALRTILKMRKKSKEEREEQEAVLDAYLLALGMI